MKMFKVITTAAALTLMTACSASVDSPQNLFPDIGNSSKSWPAYSEQALAGNVFGKKWNAITAVAKKINDKEISLEFYPESKAKACTTAYTNTMPYATVVIPAAYTTTEYAADLLNPGGTGNPLVFTEVNGAPKNLAAEKTKVRVNSISASGLNVSVYATGLDLDGYQSEINGQINVVDCAKAVDFSVWDELKGWYNLTSFDGASVYQRTAIVEYDSSRFYSRSGQRYLKALTFPLYYSVGQNSDASYNFGPIDGVGVTTVKTENGMTTYKYSYSGPMTFKGMDITMTLDLTVVKSGNTVDVSYTLEVPGNVTKTTHKFSMTK